MPIPEFKFFPKLPAELQMMVWEYAVLEPRTITIKVLDAPIPRLAKVSPCLFIGWGKALVIFLISCMPAWTLEPYVLYILRAIYLIWMSQDS